MLIEEKISEKVKTMPEELKAETLDFIEFLLEKQKRLQNRVPIFGSMKATFKMSDDFDAPLDDFKEYM
ncbi:MAG: DUF2281 domain-containing protein [Cytophagales bacterium]|jgi:hypothetical protein|nr:DUF2281 domain-containing protein [Cytophagales bacterium]